MTPTLIHPWNLSESDALGLQKSLATKVVQEDDLKAINIVAGVDVAYSKTNDTLIAAVVLLDVNTLRVIESQIAIDKATFPYIPGLFSFREIPPLIKAFEKLSLEPDLVVCDGQGYAHPRRFGLACHLGVLFDKPTIGCGKTRLTGEAVSPLATRGAVAHLIDDEEIIGHVLRTQNHVNPVFVSVGHKISLKSATDWILALAPKYRLPETTRQADQAVKKALASLKLCD